MNKLINKLNTQKGQSGFTIIEVLIVLAIGALIILAVLLAVPALQNNQKNAQRKAEASRIAGAVQQWIADGGTCTSTSCTPDNVKLGEIVNISNNKVLTDTISSDTTILATGIVSTKAYVISKATCVGTKPTANSDARKIVVAYNNEGAADTSYSACITAQR